MQRLLQLLPFAHQRVKAVFVLALLAGSVSALRAQTNIIYPADAGVINVRNAPYNAKGDGVTDDTQAIQAALSAAGGHAIVYVPNGTYLVSNTLKWNNGNPADNGGWRAFLSMQGQSRAGTVIKLKNATFTDPANPQAVIMTASGDCCGNYNDANGEGNQAFENSISYLTVDVGAGNPGAIGVDYQVSNWGGMREVTIRSSDAAKAGFCGINLLRRDNGPGIIEKVSIDGFQYGIRAGQEIAQFTLEHISLSGQSVVGIEDREAVLAIRKLTSVNAVPAVRVSSQALLNLLEADLTGGSPAHSAIEFVNPESRGYLRGITTSGYASAVRSRGTVVAGASVGEWLSDPALKLNPTDKLSLNLPIEETPVYFDSNLSNWASVGPSNGTDDTQAIQAAMNSGKGTVYFPAGDYRYSNTITVPPGVKHILGMGNVLRSTVDLGGKPLFRFTGGTSSDLTVVERFELNSRGGYLVEHASPRTVVMKAIGNFDGDAYRNQPGAGKLFINDVAIRGWYFDHPQQIWARQFNPEGDATYVVNNGATMWVLGFKVENSETLFETRNGGSTEALGGVTYTFGDRGKPAIINNGSRVALSFAGTTYVPNGVYSVLARETSGSETKDLGIGSAYGGRTYSVPMYIGEAAPSTAPYRLNAGGGQINPYAQNQYFSGNTGTFFTSDPVDVTGVTNPAPQPVYQSELNDLTGPGGTFTYNIPYLAPGGSYQVRLHFVERFFTAAGGRKFHVDLNGSRVLTDFDIFAAAGARNKAIVREFTATANAAGRVVITFTTVLDRALVNGIEILGAGQPSGPLPGTGTGLKAEYFNNKFLTAPSVLTRTDATVNFDFGGVSPAAGVNADNFSARWTGQVEAPVTGSYTFSTVSDDGVRLWVNGVQVINNWTDHAPTLDNGAAITLTAGQKYDIRMEFFESAGGAVARLLWAYPGQAQQVVPQTRLYPAPTLSAGTGLRAQYYDNIDLTNLKVTRTDPTINFVWGNGSPDPSIGGDTFSARWTGQIEPLYSETYTFYLTGDDGNRLWINGQLLIDKWQDGYNTNPATIALQGGQKYDIRVEYYENTVTADINLQWSSARQNREVVPQRQLYLPASPGTRVAADEPAGVSLTDLRVYPNPASGRATVGFVPQSSGPVALRLYNAQGKLVQRLYEGQAEAGVAQQHTVQGQALKDGLYMIRLNTATGTVSRKLVISK
jgi:hypothetical protein